MAERQYVWPQTIRKESHFHFPCLIKASTTPDPDKVRVGIVSYMCHVCFLEQVWWQCLWREIWVCSRAAGGDRHMYIEPMPNKEKENRPCLRRCGTAWDSSLRYQHIKKESGFESALCVFSFVGTLVSALCFFFFVCTHYKTCFAGACTLYYSEVRKM